MCVVQRVHNWRHYHHFLALSPVHYVIPSLGLHSFLTYVDYMGDGQAPRGQVLLT
jgi:hypothetical protein